MHRKIIKILAITLVSLCVLAIAGAGGILYGFYHFGRGLPDYQKLADYRPPVVTRLHAGDGRLLAEFAKEKRVFVPISAMPRQVIRAFLSAEDKTFYEHPGIDIPGIVVAMVKNVMRMRDNRRPIGASTITQQVAKNFLLSSELSITRKIKEMILAFRIERAFTKDRILELYLNEIYLGRGSYGVATAALNYFDKSLDELTVGESAFLAGLPKAPNNYNPVTRPEAARNRRNYVLARMVEDGHLAAPTAEREMLGPIVLSLAPDVGTIAAETAGDRSSGYFVEEVRRELVDRFGTNGVYGGGLSVRTTLDTRLQAIASRALRSGLSAYDRRHGWRGPLARIDMDGNWRTLLMAVPFPDDITGWRPAVVYRVESEGVRIAFPDGKRGTIRIEELRWARRVGKDGKRGPAIETASDVLAPGDVVVVEEVIEDPGGEENPVVIYALRQLPEVNGGVVALDPHTGRIFAMSGGLSHELSEFNRATQAQRQPGSAFKPIVYLAALEAGFTPSSLILDAPFVIDQGGDQGRWRPSNYTREFYGPSPLRIGIEKSRNLMTVRLAWKLGLDTIYAYAEKFELSDQLPRAISVALGAGETTLLRLTVAYATLVNGGKRIRPTLIDRVQDRTGKTVFRHDRRNCGECANRDWTSELVPQLPDERETVADPRAAYQIVSMLEGVVKRGTGRRIRTIGKPLAGKTGTTNDNKDTWFIGFSPDLAVGVFVGYDRPVGLGRGETGSSVAVPIFKQFMAEALKGQPAIPFRVPPDIRLVRVDPATGLPTQGASRRSILEAFLPGTIPVRGAPVLDGSETEGPALRDPSSPVRGLY